MIHHQNGRWATGQLRRLRAAGALTLLAIALATPLRGQSQSLGELRGKVTSQGTGETIIRASISVVGTKLGGYSDLNGNYTIRRVPKGRYSVRVTYVGYAPKVIEEVDVASGVTTLDVNLEPAQVQGREVVITAKGGSGTETALLAQRRKSASISDGISAAQIRRSPDANSGEALARVTGLSVVGSKFVYVRGTSERYNNTQLNGVSLTSTEPDKRSFSFDIFPSNLLENTIVSKTFTPDLPGDFSGGLVQLNTTDYPDRRTFRASIGASYVDGTTGQGMAFGPRGGTDWIGVDDGARELPSELPRVKINTGNFTPAEIGGFTGLFANDWGTGSLTAPVNKSVALSYGDRFELFENDLGVVAGFSYRNGFNYYPILRSDSNRFHFEGTNNQFSTLWGGIFNVSYKIGDLHSVSVKTTYSRTAEDEYTYLQGKDYYATLDKKLYGMHYVERGFFNGQVNGDHALPDLLGMRLQWRAFGSTGFRNEPDFRRMSYADYDPTDTIHSYIALIGSSTPNALAAGRFYSGLNDRLGGFGADLTIPLDELKFKLGTVIENKARKFRARSFGYTVARTAQGLLGASLDTLFDPSHIGEDGLHIEETTALSDRYDAESHLKAFYGMADLPFTLAGASFRLITGLRVESYRQMINTADTKPINLDSTVTDLMPSVNFVYQLSPQMNLRLAYSSTVSRPEFREYAKFAFYDFTTDALVYGNPGLRRAKIDNYDLRYEVFPGVGDLLAVSLFHKDFTDAIEEVALTGDSPERTWANAQKARNTGVELEVRKSLGFIDGLLEPLSLSVNYTWLDSRVDVAGTDFIASKAGRRLQGQSPYMINAGLYYDNMELGTSVNLLFNRFGPRITQVARTDQPDYIEQPRNVIDLSVAQTFLTNYEVKLAIRDLLAEDQVFTQDGSPSRINGKQMSTTLSVAFKF